MMESSMARQNKIPRKTKAPRDSVRNFAASSTAPTKISHSSHFASITSLRLRVSPTLDISQMTELLEYQKWRAWWMLLQNDFKYRSD
jgi:hypothetical protein